LPENPSRCFEVLLPALRDPDADVRKYVLQVIRALAPRVGGSPPGVLIEALDSADATTRCEAALAVAEFPEGLDAILTTLLRLLERDSSGDVRSYCDLALGHAKFTRAAVPTLVRALRSPEHRVRFRAADRLSYIIPRPVEVVPSLLPLLEECFEP
jgi:HEAT repeat protein